MKKISMQQVLFHFIRSKRSINPLSANPTKWSNTFKQFVSKLPTSCLSVFDHFVGWKKLPAIQKLPWDKFVRKKRTFRKIFGSIRNILELQCLVDLVDFLELMFVNAYIQYFV